MRLPWSRGSFVHFATHPWPLMAWTVFLIFPFLLAYSFQGLSLAWLWIFLCSPLFAPFVILLPFLPCHSAISVVVLFNPSLLGLLHVLFSIGYNDPILDLYSCYFEFSWPITLLVGSFGPFLSPWASLAHLLFLGILDSFSNFAFPWAFTSSFGLPWLNYRILHL